MFTSLSITNFKAFADTQVIPWRPITLVFGANSSGKSSIIHALRYARHIWGHGDCDAHLLAGSGESVDLGGFWNLVHAHETERRVGIAIELELPQNATELLRRLAGNRRLTVTVWSGAETPRPEDANSVGRPRVQLVEVRRQGQLLLSYRFVGSAGFRYEHVEPFVLAPHLAGFDQVPAAILQLAESGPAYAGERTLNVGADIEVLKLAADTIASEKAGATSRIEELKRQEYRCEGSWLLSALDARRRHGAQMRENEQAALDGRESNEFDDASQECGLVELDLLRDELAEQLFAQPLVHVGPLRQCPPRFLGEAIRGAQSEIASGVSWERIANSASVRASVNEGLRQIGVQYQLEVREWKDSTNPARQLRELLLLDGQGRELGPRDVGFGVSQVIPVICEAVGSERSLVAIEQPELHLHPALQAELGDIFLKAALPASEAANQFVLETHSEHLILRIMRRMRETYENRLPAGLPHVLPEHVAIVFVEPDGTRSIAREMPLNERGELIKCWPGGFFEESYREMFS